jgi:hypothetical protein
MPVLLLLPAIALLCVTPAYATHGSPGGIFYQGVDYSATTIYAQLYLSAYQNGITSMHENWVQYGFAVNTNTVGAPLPKGLGLNYEGHVTYIAESLTVDGQTFVNKVWVSYGSDVQGTFTGGYPTITLNRNEAGGADATYTVTVKGYTEVTVCLIICVPVYTLDSWTRTASITGYLWPNALG